VTVTRFLEAEAARARARTASIQAQLDVEAAEVNVQRAIGLLGQMRTHGSDG
jgi:outer membrane protein TolC